MSYQGVLNKTALLFALTIVTAVLTWMAGPGLWGPVGTAGAITALVLGLILGFKKEPSVPLTVLYAIAEGALVGGISAILNQQSYGVVVYALAATLLTFATVLVLFRSGKLRMTGKLQKIVVVAGVAYGLFSLINFGLVMFGVMPGMGARDIEIAGIPIGLPLSILAVLLAASFLVMDFDNTQKGVEAGVDAKYEWTASFSLLATIVWMYVEFLRIFHYIYQLAE